MKTDLFDFSLLPPVWPPQRRPCRKPISPASALALAEFQARLFKATEKFRRERLRRLAQARLN